VSEHIESPPGRSFEEEVANYYRQCGATKVDVDVLLAGNQIDVYVCEMTSSGTPVRMIVECKDHRSPVGIDLINDFAGRFARIKDARLADKAIFVSRQLFTKPARQAAEAAHIDLLTANEIAIRLARIQSVSLIAVASPELAMFLGPEGRLLGHQVSEFRSNRKMLTPLSDPNLMERVKLIAEYIRELERLATDPSGTVVSVDITGSATAFDNWISNPLYTAALQAGGRYADAYRKQHGGNGVAALRNFVLNPHDIAPEFIKNIEITLRLHLAAGVQAGIIFQDSGVPSEVVADIANMANKVCIDFGRLESYGGRSPRLLDVMASTGDPQFKRIRERVAWTADPRNLDKVVQRDEDIREVVQELMGKLPPTDCEQ
jgi:hypothetical protein